MDWNDEILDAQEKFENPEKYLADKGIRFVNYILDRIGMYIFMYSILSLVGDNLFASEMDDEMSDLGLLLLFMSLFGYWIIFEYAFGKSPAKFLTRTKVVTKQGYRPSLLQIIGRTFCRFIPFEPFSFFGSRPVGWHDSLSSTLVVKDDFETIES